MKRDEDGSSSTLNALISSDAVAALCCPLIQDPSPGVRSNSLEALATLVSRAPILADALVLSGAIHTVIPCLSDDLPPVQLAANLVLQSIGKSSSSNARSIVEMGAPGPLLQQLDSGSQEIMEAAVRTINALVLSDHDLAEVLCPKSTLVIMVQLLQLPGSSLGLQKSILSTLSAVCAFGPGPATTAAQVGGQGAITSGILRLLSSLFQFCISARFSKCSYLWCRGLRACLALYLYLLHRAVYGNSLRCRAYGSFARAYYKY